MRRLIPLTLLPFVASCAWLGSVVQKPTVSLSRVDIQELSFTGIAVDFVLAVRNPNPIGLDLARADYQLTVDGHPFVGGATNRALHLPAQGLGEAHVPVSIKFLDFVQSLEALFRKRNVPYALKTRLGFSTPIGVIDIPLGTSGNFPVPQLPDVQLLRAGLGSITLTGADLTVQLGVRNRNAYALPLGNLQYELKVAGVKVLSSGVPVGKVAANASSPIALTTHLDFLSLGLGVARAIQAHGAQVAIDGAFDLGGYRAPMHLAGTL